MLATIDIMMKVGTNKIIVGLSENTLVNGFGLHVTIAVTKVWGHF
jgi:hypothetical protein